MSVTDRVGPVVGQESGLDYTVASHHPLRHNLGRTVGEPQREAPSAVWRVDPLDLLVEAAEAGQSVVLIQESLQPQLGPHPVGTGIGDGHLGGDRA